MYFKICFNNEALANGLFMHKAVDKIFINIPYSIFNRALLLSFE